MNFDELGQHTPLLHENFAVRQMPSAATLGSVGSSCVLDCRCHVKSKDLFGVVECQKDKRRKGHPQFVSDCAGARWIPRSLVSGSVTALKGCIEIRTGITIWECSKTPKTIGKARHLDFEHHFYKLKSSCGQVPEILSPNQLNCFDKIATVNAVVLKNCVRNKS